MQYYLKMYAATVTGRGEVSAILDFHTGGMFVASSKSLNILSWAGDDVGWKSDYRVFSPLALATRELPGVP